MTALLLKTFLCALGLIERPYLRATAPDMHWSFPDATFCVHTASPHIPSTSLFGAQLRMTTKLTYLLTAYYISNDGFTAKDVFFYKSKVG